MGNTLSCCLSPNASPKLGRRKGPVEPDYESEVCEAAAGDAVAVASAPAAVEPAELDYGAGEGHHLQHISDREMPEGKAVVGAPRPSRGRLHLFSGLPLASAAPRVPPGGSRRLGLLPARSWLSQGWAPGMKAGSAWRPHPLFFSRRVQPVFFPLIYPKAQFFPPFPFPTPV